MIQLDRAVSLALARNILANVPDSYTDEQLNDIGTRAFYWVTKMVREAQPRSFEPTAAERHDDYSDPGLPRLSPWPKPKVWP